MGKINDKHYINLREKFSSKKEGFINKANLIHKDKYDYSKVVYINNKTKICIICPLHGEFNQRPDNHANLKHECPKCKSEKQSKRQVKDWNNVLIEFNNKHNFKFNYSKAIFINLNTEIIITCQIHGDFSQKPLNHLRGNSCQKCYNERRKKLSDDLFRIHRKIKSLIYNSYKNKNFTKKSKTLEILGCKWEVFKKHLEDNPYGFKIDNKELDLDHIIPISSAKTEEDIIKLNHFTNFQLLPSEYNRNIKRDKPFNELNLKEYLQLIKL